MGNNVSTGMNSFEEILKDLLEFRKKCNWKGGYIEFQHLNKKGRFGAGLFILLSKISPNKEQNLDDIVKMLDTYNDYFQSSYSDDKLRVISWIGELERINLLKRFGSSYIRQSMEEYSFKIVPY